ncbi:MAG TPA: lysophospholipase [Blastocatellia bacterium]|jgi:alpha-beta hydrolase superfamily lysophospholipase
MARVNYFEHTIPAHDGLRLFARRSEIENARAEVILVHGFGEHSGRYTQLTDYLAREGFSVTAYDHRGHGLSDGLPGHVEEFSEYDKDLAAVIKSIRERSPGVKRTFLVGHSMGGLVVLRYVARDGLELSGAVVTSPLLGIAASVPAHKMMIARVGARMAPRLRVGNEIDPAALSRDPEVGRAYATDPLVTRQVSVRWYWEAKRAMEEARESAAQIKLPILILHGTQDKIASLDATREVFERIGSKDKELGIYPDFYHELFNEPEKREVFERVSVWLEKRIS